MNQPDLFTITHEAIDRVEANADDAWTIAARKAVIACAQSNLHFTTDDVWEMLDELEVNTHDNRALGAVMRWAARQRIIYSTTTYMKSERPECHSRPIKVWSTIPQGES